MGYWLQRLMGETQATLLALLRRSRQTVTGLAGALRVTDNAVRTHIAELRRDGFVADVGAQRDTGGKPARLFELTKEGEELFPKAYAAVLGELVAEIERAQGRDRAVALLEAVGRRLAAARVAPDGGRKDVPLEERVSRAAGALRALGGDVEVDRTGAGWRLQGHGCPLSAVTAGQPAVCALAQALIATITKRRVRECCHRSGERPRCAFDVAAPR
jgi:predicted ArsR family transcriptional regulator